MNDEFEEFWDRKTEILLKFCDLYKTDKAGFKKNIYDQWVKYGFKDYESKLEKLYRQAKAMIHICGNKKIKVEKITFHYGETENA